MTQERVEIRTYNDGSEFHITDDRYHREDGPAIIHSDGTKSYYLNGIWMFTLFPDGTFNCPWKEELTRQNLLTF